MKIYIFASGSGGNCLMASSGETHLLLDAGISMRRVEAALAQAGRSVREITGVLITHEHSDHISGLKMLLKHYRLPVYAPRTIAARLRGMLPEIDPCLQVIPVGEPFRLGRLSVRAFHTSHDTDESVGYRLEDGACFAMATDLGCVTDEVLEGLRGAAAVLIEANHDLQMLCDGPYPVYLKRRILSARGHLSNEDCAALAARLADSGTRRIVLGHLSRENNSPQRALDTVRLGLSGRNVQLMCAPVSGCMELQVEEVLTCLR